MSSGNTDMTGSLKDWAGALPNRARMGRVFEASTAEQAQTLVRRWEGSGLPEAPGWPAAQRVHVALCGFGTLNYFAPFVTWAALADGAAPRVTLGGYNQLFQDLTVPASPVTGADVDLIWVWAELPDLLPKDFVANPAALCTPAGLAAVDEAVDSLTGALSAVRKRCAALLLVNELVAARRSPLGIADAARVPSFDAVIRRANDRLQERLAALGAAHVFPLGHSLQRVGLERAVDPRLRLLADCRFRPEFFFEAARGLRPYLRALKGAVRKVLCLDLDNTLWGGVVGEDGWDGVRLGEDPVGRAYSEFQAAILELYRRGVILAINSKNNPGDVQEIFERRKELLLKPEHFASIQTNWLDKATNCQTIAQEINVGVDSLVFWDDNPAERAFVRETLEDVYVVEPPADPSEWADWLRECDLFDALRVTEEDATRGRMYAEDRRRREAAGAAPDIQAFLRGLDLKVVCASACEANIPRLVSLLARTNQFNLTTRRHPEQKLREWAASPDWVVMSYAAEDKFGSYGIVGLTILKRSGRVAEIDSLLLSCRAMGKGIEEVMLAILAQQARAGGCPELRGTYIPTKKNAPIRTFLPEHGFADGGSDGEGRVYVLDLATRDLALPDQVTVEFADATAEAGR